MRAFCLTLLIAATTTGAFGEPSTSPAGGDRPNIVFILADDLGYTDVACYGSRYYETPAIDRLAAQGMRFTQGYTCGPNCQPSRAALMSGQYGPRTGVYTVGNIDRFDWQSRPLRPVDNVVSLPLDRVTVAQTLKKAGYATALFGKWHLGNGDRYHPARRGFDEAIVSMGEHFNFKTNPKVEYPPETYLADFLTDKAIDFIRRKQAGPFFLCLHHFAVHSPHEAKKDMIARFKPKAPASGHHDPTYAAMIASVDESVARVTAVLDELKLTGRTLVIFSSDNGGVGGYRREGLSRAGDITDNAPLRGGKGMLYEGGIRVPFIFRWPGHIPAATVCEQPIIGVDFHPTLLELAGASTPDQPLDGVSLVRLLASGGKEPLSRKALFWHFPGYLGAGAGEWRTCPAGAVHAGDFKLLEFFEDGRLELYNLRDDVGEKKDLAASNPDKVRELHAMLKAWREQVGAKMPTPNKDRKPPGSSPKKARKAGDE